MLTMDFQDLALDIKIRMVKLGLRQLDIVNFLMEDEGYCDYDRSSLITLVCFALNGTRQGKRYQDMLQDINGVLDAYEEDL